MGIKQRLHKNVGFLPQSFYLETHWYLGCKVPWLTMRFLIVIIRTGAAELLKPQKMVSTCLMGRGRLCQMFLLPAARLGLINMSPCSGKVLG